MNCITTPIEAFAVSWGFIEGSLNYLETERGSADAKYILDIGCWVKRVSDKSIKLLIG